MGAFSLLAIFLRPEKDVLPSVRIDPGINAIIQAAKLYAVIGQARFAQRPRSGCQAGGGEFPIIETVPRPVLSDRRDFDLSFLFRCLLANSEQKPAAPSSQHRLPRFEKISREKIETASLRLAPKILGHMRHDISGILRSEKHTAELQSLMRNS